jgi:hypothetical protein
MQPETAVAPDLHGLQSSPTFIRRVEADGGISAAVQYISVQWVSANSGNSAKKDRRSSTFNDT